MKILLVNFQRTGDIFQSFQVIFSLKKFTEFEISYLTNNIHSNALKIVEPYLENTFAIDYVTLFNSLRAGNLSQAYKYLKKYILKLNNLKFDIIVNLNFSKLSAIIMSLINANQKIGAFLTDSNHIGINNKILEVMFESLEDPDFTTNFAEVYLKVLNLRFAKPLLYPPEKRKTLKKIILHPGASRKEKEWGIENYAELGVLLQKEVIITGGKEDIFENIELEKKLKEKNIKTKNLTGQLSLNELPLVFKEADLLISGDTSIVHLAALTPLRSITIFLGNAYHYHTFPYCSDKTVIFPKVKCYPCKADFNCINQKCKKTITPEVVFKIINGTKYENVLTTYFGNDGFISLK